MIDLPPEHDAEQTSQWARRAADYISSRWHRAPSVGVVLGTGAGPLAHHIVCEQTFHYADIPHFPISTAIGHHGRLLCGTLNGRPVVAMQGRFHLYEGYSLAQATFGVRVMAELGIRTLLLSNAAGGIRPAMKNGDVMVIDSHIDLMFRRSWLFGSGALAFGRPASRVESAYCPKLIEAAHRCARANDFPLLQGTYVAMLGPNYETRAEYRFLRRVGGDAVGMSTVPEACLAHQLGLRVLAISVIANVAHPDALVPTSGQEVIDFAAAAGPKLAALFLHAVSVADDPLP